MSKKTINNILNNFVEPAKLKLEERVSEYRNELIKKSYDIKCEESEREDNLITITHVLRAEQVLRLKKKKRNFVFIILNYIVDVFSVIIGLMFDKTRFQTDGDYIIKFFIIGLIWCTLLVIKHFKEVA